MAEGTLFSVARRITDTAINLLAQEIVLLWNLKDEIEKLKDTVLTISAVLLDAEEQQQHKHQVKVWLKRVKDAIYDADNLLDDISTETSRHEVMTRNKKAKEVHKFFSKSNKPAYGHKVNAIRKRLDEIKNDRGFHLDERPVETQVGNYRGRETHSFVRSEEVIGRDKDKEEIKKIILDPSVEGNVSILPIVGLGGLGKTTLAQFVFNDIEMEKYFEQKLWVCVSNNFDVKMIVEKIIQSAKNEKLENLEMDPLIKILKDEIDGKKYLLVLDDVWNEDPKKWGSLKDLLMGGARGTRILVTTRSNKVVEITKTVGPYMLEGLDNEKSWSLFKHMAFKNGQELEKSIFEVVGKEILEKCKGVPLAIRTIGSLLYFKNTEKEWLSFKNNELSKVAQEENDILPTLKLSYDHLPSYLKQCFAYCCIFPKDFRIHKPTLIKMWVAQGFIRSSSQNQCLEDIGHDYFMELHWRSFFQEVEEDKWGDISQFKVHDLMHELAKLVASSDSATFYSKEEDIHEKILHVSIDRKFLSSLEIPISIYRASRIRTFHLPNQSQYQERRLDKSTYNAIVSSFKFIRLLDLNNTGIKTIPSSIGKLKHLRYLDVSYNPIKILPSSITRLHNLQTLRLNVCRIKQLPGDIYKLVNLAYIDGKLDLTHMPRGLGQLTKLQTLTQFVMRENNYLDFKRHGGLKELNGLNKLKGTLEIRGLRHGKDAASESKNTNMKEKQHLQELTLSWIERDVDECDVGYDEESLEALLPHGPLSNLQQLCLNGYGGVKIPSGISSLSNLVKFSLYDCNRCQHLPPLDQFHSLKSLSLRFMDNLEYISERDNSSNRGFSDSSFLPSLEQLEIEHCPNLKGWWQRQSDSVEELHNYSLMAASSFNPLSKLKSILKGWWQEGQSDSVEEVHEPSSSTPASSFKPLSKLKSMSIEDMEETLPKELMCNLISLQYLEIKYCCGPLPLSRHLTSLQNLTVFGSNEVRLTNDGDEMEWHGLQNLRSLAFWYLRNLATLPVGIQHLTSLQKLEIGYCPSLLAIPEWICNLTSLQTLQIRRCPILSKRCEREAGEDWSKIAHIPNLDIR